MNTFINPEKNDYFSYLRGTDLQDLLIETSNFFLEYRNSLNLPKDLTFGVEIEYEGLLKTKIDRFINNKLKEWTSKTDGSLHYGGEITSPIMNDDIKYWEELKIVCNYLTKKAADTLHNAGGHIHVGANFLGQDLEAWKCFLKLYTAYEHILFRFVYGDKISARKTLYRYAPPVADTIYSMINYISDTDNLFKILWNLPLNSKYIALNFFNVDIFNTYGYKKNTIEFRSPNGTTNNIVWQNNINALSKMLLAAKNKIIDEDFLDYKLNNEYLSFKENEYIYSNICLKNALEFVDLVFNNNLDKIYFLRQYLKEFQNNYGINYAIRTKKFNK